MASEKSKRRESDACKKSGPRATKMSASRRRYQKRRVACVYLLCELLAAIESGALLAYISVNCSPLWIEARGYKRARPVPCKSLRLKHRLLRIFYWRCVCRFVAPARRIAKFLHLVSSSPDIRALAPSVKFCFKISFEILKESSRARLNFIRSLLKILKCFFAKCADGSKRAQASKPKLFFATSGSVRHLPSGPRLRSMYPNSAPPTMMI